MRIHDHDQIPSYSAHISPLMDSPEHEILDLTAVDESAVKMEDSSNYYEMEVSPNLIGTIRLTVTPAHPGPVVRSVYSIL